MNRNKREAARQHYEQQRQAQAASREQRVQEKAKHDKAIQEALAKKNAAKVSTPDILLRDADLVFQRAPRLSDPPYKDAVERLFGRVIDGVVELQLKPVRSLRDWEPKGKGRDTLFRSLCEHLLAKYPTPAILWTGFFDNSDVFPPLIAHVAAGGSLSDYVKSDFPVPLTKKMCHELLTLPASTGLLQAIRLVEVKNAGGDRRLYQAWLSTRQAQELGTREEEAFWLTVIEWLAKNPMLEPSNVGPLVDYIRHRRREDNRFAMKGRSVLAMLRGMREWHGQIVHEKNIKGFEYKPSGFKPADFDLSSRKKGEFHKEIWRVREIMTSKELAAEGRRMGHCVFSYSWCIEKGQTSIWSMTLEDGMGETGNWAMLTIEVRNDLKRIVQARGRFNKMPGSREHGVLARWAGMNDLFVSLGQW